MDPQTSRTGQSTVLYIHSLLLNNSAFNMLNHDIFYKLFSLRLKLMKFCLFLMGSGKRLPDLKQYSSFFLCLLSIPALYCISHSLCPFNFFKHNHHDVLYLSHHQYFLHIKKTIWICMHLITCLGSHCQSQKNSHAYGERNKTVLINSLLRPRILATL